MEEEVFKRYIVNFNKINKYGFKRVKDGYYYEKNILNNEFVVKVNVDSSGKVTLKVYDKISNEEYINYRIIEQNGLFVNKIRELCMSILLDIRDNCFERVTYNFSQSNRINSYIINKYASNPEFLWDKYPYYGVYRCGSNGKWFAIIMYVDLSKISGKKIMGEIINVKTDNINLIDNISVFNGYHMNKNKWISIVLDDSISDNKIFSLIDKSYILVK